MMEIDVRDYIINLLKNSEKSVNRLYTYVNGENSKPTLEQFEKFRKDLIKSVKRRKENALELFPIIKYFETKKMMKDEDYDNDASLFTAPTEERIAMASPIQVLDSVPEKDENGKDPWDIKIDWDLSDIEERESLVNKATENYFKIVKEDENLREFIRIIGTFSQENIELTEIEKEFFSENVPQEVFALYESDDLNNILPTELMQLDDPDLELIFYKGLMEKKLLSYQLSGIRREIVEDWYIKRKDIEDKGPLFICLDTSGSMRGLTEVISKALTLTFVSYLEELGINIVFIPFSSRSKVYDLYGAKDKLKKVKMALKQSYYGGTDFDQLINLIESTLKTGKYGKANVLIISDFTFKNLTKSTALRIKNLKSQNYKFHSLKISSKTFNNNIENVFNSNWIYSYNWNGLYDNAEDELIQQITVANVTNIQNLEDVRTFGIIKRVKKHDYKQIKEEEEKLTKLREKAIETNQKAYSRIV